MSQSFIFILWISYVSELYLKTAYKPWFFQLSLDRDEFELAEEQLPGRIIIDYPAEPPSVLIKPLHRLLFYLEGGSSTTII